MRWPGVSAYGEETTCVKEMCGPAANAAVAWRNNAAQIVLIGERLILLKASGRAFLCRQKLEACRQPAGLDRLDEFHGQLLSAHLVRERLVVVVDRYELDIDAI